ncbi:hypothetical protein V8E54_007996 [Elaphomyces granulatus]
MVLSAIQTPQPHPECRQQYQSKTRTVRAMSDLERQEISTSVDNVEVEDVMAMGAKRQGDTNKMELEATDLPLDTDPLDWTVDQVVAVLCHSLSTPWLQRPDAAPFKAAL